MQNPEKESVKQDQASCHFNLHTLTPTLDGYSTPLVGDVTSQTCTHTCIDNHNLITCGRHGYSAKNHTI